MASVCSLSLCARVTLNLHSLNNEGTEGNQQMTRMVHILDQAGQRHVVNAISGDMFKHIFVEHLIPLLDEAGQPLSPGARMHSADRINAQNPEFVQFCEDRTKRATETEVMTRMLTDCSVTDIAGTLVTRGRSVGRKSIVEFGWVVGKPDVTTTEQYFHVKYAPESRADAAGGDTVAEKQAIFHRPASSGVYALICALDLYRIGMNDITREYVVPKEDRLARARAVIKALAATLAHPSGAQRNTQNPHILGCEGIIATSSNSLPAPTISPLADDYREQVEAAQAALNGMRPGSIESARFASLAEALERLGEVAARPDLLGE